MRRYLVWFAITLAIVVAVAATWRARRTAPLFEPSTTNGWTTNGVTPTGASPTP